MSTSFSDFFNRIQIAYHGRQYAKSKVEIGLALTYISMMSLNQSSSFWEQVLVNATSEWFDKFLENPAVNSAEFVLHKTHFCLGVKSTIQETNLEKQNLARVMKPLRLWGINPNLASTSAKDDVHADLIKRQLPLFVTTAWEAPQPNCLTEYLDEVGLGDQFVKLGEERILVSLRIAPLTAIYKPTWVDSGLWFYWMPNLNLEETWGHARTINKGLQGRKEWILNSDSIVNTITVTNLRSIKSTKNWCSQAEALPLEYWDNCHYWAKNTTI
jgi:hypothetical protein